MCSQAAMFKARGQSIFYVCGMCAKHRQKMLQENLQVRKIEQKYYPL
jgi:hypothetical protein